MENKQFLRFLGAAIAHQRKIKKMTQVQLAEKSDISITTLRDIENAWSNPRVSTVQKIAVALDIPLGVLVRWEKDYEVLQSIKPVGNQNKCVIENRIIEYRRKTKNDA